ncbi:MAG: glycosyltransferase, partial [Clostridia bacterium]|nr:glycosyltransferase [Clostridia bacterium]
MEKTVRKLRVAMIGQKRVPSREGGVEVVVEELATRMAALGYRVTCYNRKGRHVAGAQYGAEALSEYKGVFLRSVPTLDIRGLAAASASVMGAIAAAFGPYDVVHFHAEGPSAMCWLPKLAGKRVIVTVHGLDHRREKWGKFARAFILLGERCA